MEKQKHSKVRTLETEANQKTSLSKLNIFAWVTAAMTLVLIGIGGLVTSHGVGMAVPDWPTTYGYNMFLFPISKWVGGIFYEHTHRLVASVVGLLTMILTVWLWVKESRAWVKWLGIAAFLLVVVQGVLGGLRVTMLKDEIGILHGTLAQLFFITTCTLAIVTSRAWAMWNAWAGCEIPEQGLRRLLTVTTAIIFVQLALGASMRHQHAGLAVPDFPLAYGKLYPPTDADTLRAINSARVEDRAFNEIQPFHIHLHMAHRFTALLIVGCVCASWLKVRKATVPTVFRKLANTWVALIALQFLLGAVTVLKNKPADIATAHVVVGAVTLAVGFTLVLLSRRLLWETSRPIPAETEPSPRFALAN